MSQHKHASIPPKSGAHHLIGDMHLIAQEQGLRLLNSSRIFEGKAEYECSSIADIVRPWIDKTGLYKNGRCDMRLFISRCRRRYQSIAVAARLAGKRVASRLQPLISELDLDEAEINILLLALGARADRTLSGLCREISFTNSVEGVHILAPAFSSDPSKLAKLLSGRGRLHQCGLLTQARRVEYLGNILNVSNDLFDALYADGPLIEQIQHRVLLPVEEPVCVAQDYLHLEDELRLLEAVLIKNDGPRHVLLAGPPGVGKTELTRGICKKLGWQGFAIGCADEGGVPANRNERFSQYALATELLKTSSNVLLIFDEAEDVFVGDHWTHVEQSKERHKGWTNHLLETTRVPTIWITNTVDCIDPAYLRRFDHVLQLRTPPRSVRKRLIETATHGHAVSPRLLDRIADCDDFTPADAARIARVLPHALTSGMAPDNALINLASARPGGMSRAALAMGRESGLSYRLEWLNVDVNLERLITQIKTQGAGTLVFSGPPGTGKTALAKYLATALDRPLMTKKASDLISPYVGETEQRIARAFERARDDDAVLLLDEADSFVRSRTLAQRSWEVSQVNEVLSHLDGYSGVAILATNHADSLDHALQRRLDVKLSFGYLRPEHAWAAFKASLESIGLACPADDSLIAARVRGLREFALGDFAAVLRGLRLCVEQPTAEQLCATLAQEVKLKSGERQPIGFRTA